MVPFSRSMYGSLALIFLVVAGIAGIHIEKHNQTDSLRTLTSRHEKAFFERHKAPYRFATAVHYAQAKAYDVLERTPLSKAASYDAQTDADFLFHTFHPPLSESINLYSRHYTSQTLQALYRILDWTWVYQEETYDILAAPQIPWGQKDEWTRSAMQNYLRINSGARSPAPLDVTLRRAGTVMKPYFTYFRNYYPETNNYILVAHWWHPAIYEAIMISGNDDQQTQAILDTHSLYPMVLQDRPLRMLLSREAMPRYARMSPESANIFDNLHALQDIAYDISAYEGWSLTEKRKELHRVMEAMSYHRGDEKYARKFETPHPEMDPRTYSSWMKSFDGSINQILMEMLQEVWLCIASDGPEIADNIKLQIRLKLTPGMQEGEIPGSLLDAIQKLRPDFKMDEEELKPGVIPRVMVQTMLKEWQKKYGHQLDIEPFRTDHDPSLPPIPQRQEMAVYRAEQVAAADRQ